MEEQVSKKQQKENLGEETIDAEKELNGEEQQKTPEQTPKEDFQENSSNIEEQLAEAQSEAAELKDRMLRLAADYENYKKRTERERATAMKYAGEKIFREFLPVVDNLERAVNQGKVETADAEKQLAGLMEGVELTLQSLYASLNKFEVEAIESEGQPFDPNKQEALTMQESDTVPANHVVTEFEKGYFYKDRLLRAAKVIVSSGKANE